MLKKLSIGFLVLSSVCGGAWLAWWLLKNYWAPILFFSYVAIGLLISLTGVVVIRKTRGTREMIAEAASPAPWWRKALSSTLRFLEAALAWPASIVQFLLNRSDYIGRDLRHMSASGSLHPADVVLAITSLTMVIATYLVDFPIPRRMTFGREMMSLVYLQVVVRHLSYAVDQPPVPVRLRRSPGNAYLKFITVAACDFCSLVLAITGLFHWIGKGLPSIGSFHDVTIDMLRFQKLQEAVQGQRIQFADVMTTIAGSLYYFMLLTTILRFKEFRRDEKDYLALAFTHLMLGRYNEGFKYLSQIKAPSPDVYRVRALLYLGVNQIDKAWSSMLKAEELAKEGLSDPDYADATLITLAASFAGVPLTPAHAREIIQQAVANAVSDFALYTAVDMLLMLDVTVESWPDLLEEQKYPLTRIRLMLADQKYDEARASLQGLKVDTHEDEVIRRVLILLAGIPPWTSDDEDRQTFESWTRENLRFVGREISQVQQERKRLGLIGALHGLALVAEKVGPQRVEEIKFLANELSGSIGDENRRFMEAGQRFLRARLS